MNNDLISISEAKKLGATCLARRNENGQLEAVISLDEAPTVEYTFEEAFQKTVCENRLYCPARPQGEWIPVNERLPNDLEPVNITWINHEPEPYYKEIKDKPFTATGVYFNGQWYWYSSTCTDILAYYSHNFNDVMDTAIEVIAWQPLPEPYKEGGAE